ncbi:hypothetical protein TIFTF001_017378 [Ficus carica]|uniref:Uncharacterized protein n=1 Tax=Ficus carica TaxID=3494 RepID=A0AA88AQL4_FICCA|nr:hypothetical protein TIFTF001_017378 [Ficus carica]
MFTRSFERKGERQILGLGERDRATKQREEESPPFPNASQKPPPNLSNPDPPPLTPQASPKAFAIPDVPSKASANPAPPLSLTSSLGHGQIWHNRILGLLVEEYLGFVELGGVEKDEGGSARGVEIGGQ